MLPLLFGSRPTTSSDFWPATAGSEPKRSRLNCSKGGKAPPRQLQGLTDKAGTSMAFFNRRMARDPRVIRIRWL